MALTTALSLTTPAGAIPRVAQDWQPPLKDIPGRTLISGKDRRDTAGQAYEWSLLFAHTVVIANADSYVDATTVAPLAAAMNAPVILIRPGEDPRNNPGIRSAGSRTRPQHVYLIGGEHAIPTSDEAPLKDYFYLAQFHRIGGATRIETNQLINQHLNTLKPPTTSYFVDANNAHGDQQLLAGAYAAKTNGQVILTYPDQPAPQPTTNTTYTFTPTLNPNAQPIPGNDPAAQSFWLAKHTTPKPTTPALTVSSDPRHVVDALAAGPLSGIFNRPLIMAPSTDETINKAMTDWLATRHVTAFGPANKVWLGPNPITHQKP